MLFSTILMLVCSDIPICEATDNQFYPVVTYAFDKYYVFWEDRRSVVSDTLYCVFGARVTVEGTVLDPEGRLIFANQVHYDIDIAFDGANFLVAFEDSC